jgi:hypothetical protein
MGIDIKNFYLNTPLDRYEYMRFPAWMIPDKIMDQYNLHDLLHDGYVYAEIRKGMYGLPQAGLLANKLLVKRLAKHGYAPTTHTHGLWKHSTRPILFSLVVDDFGVKYVGKEHVDHLVKMLELYYPISIDWKGGLYCGIKLDWDYTACTVDLSMPGYVAKALHHFQHPTPNQPYHSPAKWTAPQYGAKVQLTAPADLTEPMSNQQTTTLRQVVGKFLFYARAVDPTMLEPLNELATAQSKGTQETAKAMTPFLNYCATHPDATIRYQACDMILHIHSDASYLSAPEARSRAGGHHFLGNAPNKPPINNGPILNLVQVLRTVMPSAAEAEVGALFVNTKEAVPLQTALEEMDHPQPATPMQTDNTTAFGIVHNTVKQQRSKAMDMRFYWVRDRVKQGQFHVYWAPGTGNLADYFTKKHSPTHHQRMRPIYLHSTPSSHLRGCVDSPVTRKLIRRPSVHQHGQTVTTRRLTVTNE